MDCPDITTLEQAEAKLPSSVLPIDGLRRGDDGTLTRDSLNTVVDGLKSRGINIFDRAVVGKMMKDLESLLCSVNKQYQFLLHHIVEKQGAVPDTLVDAAKTKNIFMLDILTVFRHIQGIIKPDASSFIEGWQNSPGTSTADTSAMAKKLAEGRAALEEHSMEELRRHMVDVTVEKNKVASNNLGFYGFLNIIAVGLIIYAAAMNK
jgi:biotin operon repressor